VDVTTGAGASLSGSRFQYVTQRQSAGYLTCPALRIITGVTRFWPFAASPWMRRATSWAISAWPKGPCKGGVSYGDEVVFIITLSEQANPNVRTCADKNP
jgi:hypothetical protein